MEPARLLIATTTFSQRADATAMARRVIGEQLAACAQVEGPLESHYRWKGEDCQETEWRLTIKTTAAAIEKLSQVVHQNHPYEQPQWVVVEVRSTSEGYAAWVRASIPPAASPQA